MAFDLVQRILNYTNGEYHRAFCRRQKSFQKERYFADIVLTIPKNILIEKLSWIQECSVLIKKYNSLLSETKQYLLRYLFYGFERKERRGKSWRWLLYQEFRWSWVNERAKRFPFSQQYVSRTTQTREHND